MTPEAAKQIWENYARAWRDIPAAERETLMRGTLAENVTYTAPDMVGHGIADFAEKIAGFQTQYPGAYFGTRSMIVYADQSLTEWTMYTRDGTAFVNGTSYARFNSQGLIEQLAGFWSA